MGNCCITPSVKDKYTESEIKDIDTFHSHFTKELCGYISSVYDGDTCTAIIIVDNKPVKINIRMNGYDCAEMKPSKQNKDRDHEIKFAKIAKEKLSELVLHKRVKIKSYGLDKYGRLLATLYSNNVIVNEYMLENHYGYTYSGEKKPRIEYHDDYYVLNDEKITIREHVLSV